MIVFGNVAVAVWITLDTMAFLLADLTAGIAFLITALIAIYGILKFLGCLRPCFNCKKCTFGMGRIAALYFGKIDLKDYAETYHLPTAVLFYVLLGPFPATVLLISSLSAFNFLKAAVLSCLVAL